MILAIVAIASLATTVFAVALVRINRKPDRQDHDAIIRLGDEAPLAFRGVQELPPELISEHTFPTFTE